jgi:hypothetical protein
MVVFAHEGTWKLECDAIRSGNLAFSICEDVSEDQSHINVVTVPVADSIPVRCVRSSLVSYHALGSCLASDSTAKSLHSTIADASMLRLRPRITILLLTLLITLSITWHILTIKAPLFVSRVVGGPEHKHPFTYVGLPADAFNWTSPNRPAWLEPPKSKTTPLVLRFAIVSHPKEFARRKAIRETVLADIPRREVKLEYYFFLGKTNKLEEVNGRNMTAKEVNTAVQKEKQRYGDLYLLDMTESSRGLGEKRWRALQWVRSAFCCMSHLTLVGVLLQASEAPRSTYDWFFTADTDSFVRFAALARRLATLKPKLRKPREQRILWGQMLVANRHWRDSQGVPEEQKIESGDYEGQWYSGDESYEGEWYSYPVGLGYLIRFVS